MGIYLSLSKSYVEKTMKEASERGKKELGNMEGAEDTLLWHFDEDCAIEVDKDSNEIRLTSQQSPIGYIQLWGEPNADEQIDIVELAIKRLNKFKTILESLK